MKTLSVDALAYEAIQKCIRNPVIGHIRGRLQAKYTNVDELMQALFKNEWNGIVQGVSRAQAAGYDRKPLDALDHLSLNQLPNVVEKYWDVLIPEEQLPSGETGKIVRGRLISWLSDVKDLRNPNAHPPEQDMPIADALRVVDNGKRILDALGLDGPLGKLEEIRSELTRRAASADYAEDAARSSILSTLPPRELMYAEFIGRSKELQDLWKWFSDKESGRWALVGEGGKGKTAIAHQFCLGVVASDTDDVTAVIWLSAKRRRFEDSSTLPISNPDFWDLDSALECLVRDLGLSDSGKSTNAKRLAVLETLRELPILLVADDLDSVERESEDVVEFFMYDIPRVGGRVLITSRREYPGMGRTMTRVSGLPQPDALDFTLRAAARLGIERETDLRQSFNRIFQATEGSPLFIEDLLRVCRQLRVSEAITRWKEQSGDAARRYALEREMQLLTDTARRALRAVCWASQPLSVAQMEVILGKTEQEILSAVRELEEVSLVPVGQTLEGIPVFQAHKNLESLIRRDMKGDPNDLGLRNAVDSVLKTIRVDDSDSDVFRQVTVRLKSQRPQEALELVDRAIQRRPSSPVLLALRAETLTRLSPPRIADARQDWKRAAELGLSRVESFMKWIFFEDAQKNFHKMAQVADMAIEACGEVALLYKHAGYAWSRVGQDFRRGLDSESAGDALDKAESRLRRAVALARAEHWEDYKLDHLYRSLVINGQAMKGERSDGQVVHWVTDWLKQMPHSADARAEAQRQAGKYGEIRSALANMDS